MLSTCPRSILGLLLERNKICMHFSNGQEEMLSSFTAATDFFKKTSRIRESHVSIVQPFVNPMSSLQYFGIIYAHTYCRQIDRQTSQFSWSLHIINFIAKKRRSRRLRNARVIFLPNNLFAIPCVPSSTLK